MSGSLPIYESGMRESMDWLDGSETTPANLSERNKSTPVFGTDSSNVKKLVSNEQAVKVSITKPETTSDSLPTYESVVREYMYWCVESKTTPANLTERYKSTSVFRTDSSNVKKIVTNEQSKKVGSTFVKGVDSAGKKTRSYYKGYFSNESCGSYQDVMDALAKPVSSYSLLFEHPSVQKPFTPSKKKVNVLNCKAIVRKHHVPKSTPEFKKTTWKETNRFPTNVRSLIVTGMLDEVAVRYVSLSQEKLRGFIKGSGYRCGCGSCNYSKTLTADEFERHAGCKTSHPNNHIRFQNGKTIHQIVQELKSTPENMLFDVIQTVTGSPINQSAFCAWKGKNTHVKT